MKLYLSALGLPESDPETIDSATSDKTDKMTVTFKKQIPTFYWEVFDPFTKEEAVCADFAEDLSEIAADRKNGMKHKKHELMKQLMTAMGKQPKHYCSAN